MERKVDLVIVAVLGGVLCLISFAIGIVAGGKGESALESKPVATTKSTENASRQPSEAMPSAHQLLDQERASTSYASSWGKHDGFAVRVYQSQAAAENSRDAIPTWTVEEAISKQFKQLNLEEPLIYGDSRGRAIVVDFPVLCLLVDYSYDFYEVRLVVVNDKQILWAVEREWDMKPATSRPLREVADWAAEQFVREWKDRMS